LWITGGTTGARRTTALKCLVVVLPGANKANACWCRPDAAALQNCGRRTACPFVSDCFGAPAWKEEVPKSTGPGGSAKGGIGTLSCSACRAETVRLPFSVSQTAKKPAVAERCIVPAKTPAALRGDGKRCNNGNCAETARRRVGIKAAESTQKTRIRMNRFRGSGPSTALNSTGDRTKALSRRPGRARHAAIGTHD
jgi:hypothetical protein